MRPPRFSLGRFGRDRRGVSAVEFALLAPVMVAFYFGLSELCQGYMAQKRVGHVASIIADLVSQDDVVTSDEIADIFGVADTVMAPFPDASLAQRITSVTVDRYGTARVDWSRGDGMTARGNNSTVALPDDLVAEGESLIMAEVTYDYDSPADYLMPGLTRFSQTYYLRPRRVDRVEFD